MRIRKHLYPAIKNFVYWNTSTKTQSTTDRKDSLHDDLALPIILYIIFIVSKLIVLKMQLGLIEIIWTLVSGLALLSGWFLVRTINDPRISDVGHGLITFLGMGIAGAYGMFGVLLPCYKVLYISWIVIFLLSLSILCTYYWIHHCLIWDKFGSKSKNGKNGWAGISLGAGGIITAIMASCIRVFQTGGHWIFDVAIALLSILLMVIAAPFSMMGAMRLYYYYRYLRNEDT